MSVIVQDSGFVADDWDREILDWDVTSQSSWEPAMGYGLDIPNTLLASQLTAYFNRVAIMDVGQIIARGTSAELIASLGAREIATVVFDRHLSVWVHRDFDSRALTG